MKFGVGTQPNHITPFPNKVTFTVLRIRIWTEFYWATTQSTIDIKIFFGWNATEVNSVTGKKNETDLCVGALELGCFKTNRSWLHPHGQLFSQNHSFQIQQKSRSSLEAVFATYLSLFFFLWHPIQNNTSFKLIRPSWFPCLQICIGCIFSSLYEWQWYACGLIQVK